MTLRTRGALRAILLGILTGALFYVFDAAVQAYKPTWSGLDWAASSGGSRWVVAGLFAYFGYALGWADRGDR